MDYLVIYLRYLPYRNVTAGSLETSTNSANASGDVLIFPSWAAIIFFRHFFLSLCYFFSCTDRQCCCTQSNPPFRPGIPFSAHHRFLIRQVSIHTCRFPPFFKPNNNPNRHTFAMNQVFYIEELVQRIASSADDEPAGSASLLALACCCKSLEDPVMEVLWQRQKDLQIVLRTLPADCWAVTNKVYVSRGIWISKVTHPPRTSALNQTPHSE